MQIYEWYGLLSKPAFAPPAWIFSFVWAFLYILILASFGYIFYLVYRGKLAVKYITPFFLNVVFNLGFSILEFKMQNLELALLDILLVLGTLIWATVMIYPKVRWVAYAQIPYLLWVSFATILQISIVYLN
jgi:tryptophan-rich sensory protein